MVATYVPGPHGPMGFSIASAGGDSTATTNFLARTSGLDATHTNAYKAILNGLTTDGLFNSDGTSSFFDVLYILATQDQTTALLNLVGTNFPLLNANSFTFTADSGFTGDGNGAHFLNTNFNASTASTPNYVQNSAHLSFWNLTNSTFGSPDVGGGSGENIYAKFSDNNIYARVNDSPESGGFAISDPRGHILGNRSSSTARQLYQNASTTLNGGTAASYGSVSSQALNNQNFQLLIGTTHQMAMFSAGSSLSATNVTNFYNRLRTYMTAIGVP